MKKILYDKRISLGKYTYSYCLKTEGEKIVLEGREKREEKPMFRFLADVSGFHPAYMILFLEELVNSRTQPSCFREILEENLQFFFSYSEMR